MTFKKISVLILISLLTVSCSSSKNSKYKSTEHLETPPKMKVIKTPKIPIENGKDEVIEKKGFGESVLLDNENNKSTIKIKKTFERSWEIIDQALKLNEIEITDKNRDRGVFYVTYDPDDQSAGESTFIDKITFFIFNDEYVEADYKLTVTWRESDTEIIAEVVNTEKNDLLDDGEDDDMKGTTDSGDKLLKALYKTIKDDLPVN